MREHLNKLIKKHGRRVIAAANDEAGAAAGAAPAANAGTVDLAAPAPAVIAAGNASNAFAGFANQRVTSFVSGMPIDVIERMLNFVAPPVGVGMKFDYAKTNAANMLMTVDDDRIGANGLPAVIAFDPDTYPTGTLAFRGLETGYSEEEERVWSVQPGGSARQINRRVTQMKNAILRGRALRMFTLIEAAVPVSTPVALVGTTSPIATFKGYIQTVAEACGDRNMVRMLIGSSLYEMLTNHPMLTGASGANGQRPVGLADLAKLLELPEANLMVSYNQYATSKQGKTLTKGYLFTAAQVLVFAANQNANEDDPSAIKSFYLDQDGNQMVGYDYQPHPTQKRTGLKYYEKVIVTNSDALVHKTFTYSAT